MNITKIDAIQSLKPGAKFSWTDDVITWRDAEQTEPTQSEIDAEIVRLQAIEDYQVPRRAGYKQVHEQLDQLYHDMAADKGDKTGEWFKAIKAVKDATPKP